jgi:hypothetical protein
MQIDIINEKLRKLYAKAYNLLSELKLYLKAYSL